MATQLFPELESFRVAMPGPAARSGGPAEAKPALTPGGTPSRRGWVTAGAHLLGMAGALALVAGGTRGGLPFGIAFAAGLGLLQALRWMAWRADVQPTLPAQVESRFLRISVESLLGWLVACATISPTAVLRAAVGLAVVLLVRWGWGELGSRELGK